MIICHRIYENDCIEEASMSGELKALEFFKDWTNYLLVTTVAAVGWLGVKEGIIHASRGWRIASLWCFAISIVFAIFTLAIIPQIAEALSKFPGKSIYDTRVPIFALPRGWILLWDAHLAHFCWIQHVAFLLGIIFYAIGASFPEKKRWDI
jgi:hypothetical protein